MDKYNYAKPIPPGVTYFSPQTNRGLMLCLGYQGNQRVDVVHVTGTNGATAWFRYGVGNQAFPKNPVMITPAVAAGVSYADPGGGYTFSVLSLM